MPFGRRHGHGSEERAYGEPGEASRSPRVDDRPLQSPPRCLPGPAGGAPHRAHCRCPTLPALAPSSPVRRRAAAAGVGGAGDRAPLVRGPRRASSRGRVRLPKPGYRERRVPWLRRLHARRPLPPGVRCASGCPVRRANRDHVRGGPVVALSPAAPERSPRPARNGGDPHPAGRPHRRTRDLGGRPPDPRGVSLPSRPIRARSLKGRAHRSSSGSILEKPGTFSSTITL